MKAFVDSNVLVYALAHDDTLRQGTARRLLTEHGTALALSTQVLLETYNVLTRKKGATPDVALAALRLFEQHHLVAPSAASAFAALALSASHQLSIWDAMIVQAALQAGCDTLFSEDLSAGQRFGALQVVNPFQALANDA